MKKHFPILAALLAAALYALNAPLSKLLLQDVPPSMMAACLYLGAGVGMLLLGLIRRAAGHPSTEQPLSQRDLPYLIGMIVLDIAAPILLMLGISRTSACYAAAPFIGVLLSLVIFRQWPGTLFFGALAVMIVATVLVSRDGAEAEADHA